MNGLAFQLAQISNSKLNKQNCLWTVDFHNNVMCKKTCMVTDDSLDNS